MTRMTRALVIAVAALALALPAVANAHVTAGEVTCTQATFNATGWSAGAVQPWSLEVDGVETATGVHTFTSSEHAFVLPLTLAPGDHALTFSVGSYTASASVTCPAPQPPTPPTPPTPAPPAPPTPPTPAPPTAGAPATPAPTVGGREQPTCAELRAVGAGKRWLVKFGCGTRARIDCGDVPNTAGRAWFDGSRLGFRCPLPQRLRVRSAVVMPAVTG